MKLMTADDNAAILRELREAQLQDGLTINRLKYQVRLLRRALTVAATLFAVALWFDIVVEASRWISR